MLNLVLNGLGLGTRNKNYFWPVTSKLTAEGQIFAYLTEFEKISRRF